MYTSNFSSLNSLQSYHTDSWEYWRCKPFGSSRQPHFLAHCHWELLQHYWPDLLVPQLQSKTNPRNQIRMTDWENWTSPPRCSDGRWTIRIDFPKFELKIMKNSCILYQKCYTLWEFSSVFVIFCDAFSDFAWSGSMLSCSNLELNCFSSKRFIFSEVAI